MVVVLVGCQSRTAGTVEPEAPEYRAVADFVAAADAVVLYEGLPHEIDRELVKKELERTETVQLHEFPFYAEPLRLADDDHTTLPSTFSDATVVTPWRGRKSCPPFHPDYCVEFRRGEEFVRLLICFGCHEIKVHGAAGELHCDMTNAGRSRLEELFAGRRSQRPDAVFD